MYWINKNTKAIKVNKTGYFNTEIVENSREKFSIHDPITILDSNCIEYGSSLDGRYEYARKVLQSNSKLPVCIMPGQGIFMFPTKSTKKKDCVWIAYYHVERFEQRNSMTYIYFKDNTGMYVNISSNQFDLQMKRTSQVIAAVLKIIFD